MGRFTFTLDDKQQAIADQMAADKGLSVKECLSRLLLGRIAHYETVVAEHKWANATPEQKQAAVKVLSKGVKDGKSKQKKTKKKAG